MHNLTALSLALPGTPLHGLADFEPRAQTAAPAVSRTQTRARRRRIGLRAATRPSALAHRRAGRLGRLSAKHGS
jgi:hypothetical protein